MQQTFKFNTQTHTTWFDDDLHNHRKVSCCSRSRIFFLFISFADRQRVSSAVLFIFCFQVNLFFSENFSLRLLGKAPDGESATLTHFGDAFKERHYDSPHVCFVRFSKKRDFYGCAMNDYSVRERKTYRQLLFHRASLTTTNDERRASGKNLICMFGDEKLLIDLYGHFSISIARSTKWRRTSESNLVIPPSDYDVW